MALSIVTARHFDHFGTENAKHGGLPYVNIVSVRGIDDGLDRQNECRDGLH